MGKLGMDITRAFEDLHGTATGFHELRKGPDFSIFIGVDGIQGIILDLRISAVIIHRHGLNHHAELSQIAGALGGARMVDDLRRHREEEHAKGRDDRNDHQQLDESECSVDLRAGRRVHKSKKEMPDCG